MATLARRSIKVVLFLVLFILAVMFVHTYPYPMPQGQLDFWFSVSEFLGVSNPEDVYFPVMWALDLVVAIIAYKLIIWFWRKFRQKTIN
jgi:glucan phosphoethanolaminetransferase (alkaline phosphatase superfamily)